MERAKAERLAAIEAENAVIAERLRWQNIDPEELRKLEEEAAHKRYAEAVANSVLMGKDPVKEDFSVLVEGLDPERVKQELAKVAATMAAMPEIEIMPGVKVDGARVKAKIDQVDLHASIGVDRDFLEKKATEEERV
jgi:molybdenum cofactor biosynthesis enzyme MoaA